MSRAANKEATRNICLAIAKASFGARPYAQVTFRQMAAAAGVSTGAFFLLWPDKATLYREAMGREPGVAAFADFIDRVCVVCAGQPGDVGALSVEAEELRASIVRGG